MEKPKTMGETAVRIREQLFKAQAEYEVAMKAAQKAQKEINNMPALDGHKELRKALEGETRAIQRTARKLKLFSDFVLHKKEGEKH